MTTAVEVSWKDQDDIPVVHNQGGYFVSQGTVDENHVQTATLTIQSSTLSELSKSSSVTYKCAAQSLRYPLQSDKSPDINVVVTVFSDGKLKNWFAKNWYERSEN